MEQKKKTNYRMSCCLHQIIAQNKTLFYVNQICMRDTSQAVGTKHLNILCSSDLCGSSPTQTLLAYFQS